jgi:hypothetical protein
MPRAYCHWWYNIAEFDPIFSHLLQLNIIYHRILSAFSAALACNSREGISPPRNNFFFSLHLASPWKTRPRRMWDTQPVPPLSRFRRWSWRLFPAWAWRRFLDSYRSVSQLAAFMRYVLWILFKDRAWMGKVEEKNVQVTFTCRYYNFAGISRML